MAKLQLDPAFVAEFDRIRTKLDRMNGPNVVNGSRAIHIRALKTQMDKSPLQRVRLVLVKVTGNASGGGKYNGRVLTQSATPASASGDLAEADLGTVPSSDNALILNAAEQGKSTHDLTAGSPVSKIFPGYLQAMNNSGGNFVVVINGIDWENCT